MRCLLCMAVVLLLSTLVACDKQAMLAKFSSPEDQAVARGYIDDLRAGRLEVIEKVVDDSIAGPNLHGTLANMAGLIPAGDPDSVEVVGALRVNGADATSINTTFEYRFGEKWLLINVAVQDKGGVRTIVGFHVTPEAQSLKQQNAFDLSGRSLLAYAVLAAAIVAVLVTFYALVLCVRTRMERRKWAWIIFILLGIGKISINWATGEWAIVPLSIQLFSASAFAALNGPWIIAASLPLGAIMFITRTLRRPVVREVEPETKVAE